MNALSPAEQSSPPDEAPGLPEMVQALATLLDQVPGAREVLIHLAALEQILPTYGSVALDHIPLPVLARICTQLGGLPARADDRALAALHELLTSTLERRRQPRQTTASILAGFRLAAEEPIVSEASLSDFHRLSAGRDHPA